MSPIISLMLLALAAYSFGLWPREVHAAPLPKATEEILKTLKLNPSVMADIDEELKVPKEWLDRAKKEGKVRLRSSPWRPAEQKAFFAPFKERYPFIEIEFSGTNQEDRSIKTLVAYRSGKVLSDVLTSVGGFISEYKQARALDDLRGLPTWSTVPEEAKDPEGIWVGMNIRYWCLSYNTKLVKKEEIPKRWEDLLHNPRWRNGNLALGNRPQLWALMVWKANGEPWTRDFLTKLFLEVKPQLRREGLNSMVQLAAAGEFHAALPSNEARTYQLAEQGAPVSFTCPEPVPVAPEDMILLRGSAHPHAGRVFINWMLSKEGQLAGSFARHTTPIHKGLQYPELTPFADQILGRKTSYRDPDSEHNLLPRISDLWDDLWSRGAGKAR